MGFFARLAGACLLPIAALIMTPAGRASDPDITKADYFVEGLAPVRKSGPYDLTIVYFMDYQCPACRQYTPDVARVLKEDRRIRVIYRDTPLLGPRSDEAARAAIASAFQGRHEPFHHALMTAKAPLDQAALEAAARRAGVDWPRLQRDMVSRREEIDLLIGRNIELATLVGIAGTPAFIVGQRQSNGALDYRSLKLEIADARRELGKNGQAPAPVIAGTPETGEVEPPRPGPPPVAAPPAKAAKGAAVSFDRRIDTPPAPPGERPADGDRRTWPVAALLAALAAVALWAFARARRKARRGGREG